MVGVSVTTRCLEIGVKVRVEVRSSGHTMLPRKTVGYHLGKLGIAKVNHKTRVRVQPLCGV